MRARYSSRRGAVVARLLVMILSSLAVAPHASAVIEFPEAALPLKVLVVGCSLSVYNDGTLPPRYDRSWSYLLQQANPGVNIVNIAFGGTDTRFWTSENGIALLRQHNDADYVLMQMGMIDAGLLFDRIPVDEFSSRLAVMANQFSRERVWVTPVWNTIAPNADPDGDALKAGYEDFIVAEAGTRWNLGPDLHFMSSTDFLSEDGVHANQNGQNAYAQAIADTVPFLVPEPSTASLAGLGLLVLGAIGRRRRS
jgi:MYXO-CTERM domain-containing protein